MESRTRHGQEFWERHLELWRKSGKKQLKYCEDAGLSIKTFNRWKSRLSKATVGKAPMTIATSKEKSLIPIRLATPESGSANLGGVRDIRIKFDNGQWVVDVPSGVDSAHLCNVLKAIASAAK